jgi:hypothetical protein
MERRMHEVFQLKKFYDKRREQMVKLHAMETRARSRAVTDGLEVPNVTVTNGMGFPGVTIQKDKLAFKEYDREAEVAREHKRRVRFEQDMKQDRELRQDRAKTSQQAQGTEQTTHKERTPLHTAEQKAKKQKQADKQQTRSDRATAEAERRGAIEADKRGTALVHDMYETDDFKVTNENGVVVYHESKFASVSAIDDASDFTLATFLMENKVNM